MGEKTEWLSTSKRLLIASWACESSYLTDTKIFRQAVGKPTACLKILAAGPKRLRP